MRSFNWRIIVAALAAFALLIAACGGDDSSSDTTTTQGSSGGDATTSAAAQDLTADLLGAGASFPALIYQEWIGEYHTNVQPGVSINYQSIGSGGGVEQFIGQQTDFGASDAFLSDEDLAAAADARGCEAIHIPTVFGAVSVGYNLDGVDTLTLDGPTLADIFLGNIDNWSDPAIAALNRA